MTQDETLEMAFSMMSNRQKQHFKEAFEVDIGYGVQGLGLSRQYIPAAKFYWDSSPGHFGYGKDFH